MRIVRRLAAPRGGTGDRGAGRSDGPDDPCERAYSRSILLDEDLPALGADARQGRDGHGNEVEVAVEGRRGGRPSPAPFGVTGAFRPRRPSAGPAPPGTIGTAAPELPSERTHRESQPIRQPAERVAASGFDAMPAYVPSGLAALVDEMRLEAAVVPSIAASG